MVTVNSQPVKASHSISPGETIKIRFSLRQKPSFEPENIPLNIVYEDEHLIVVNKPAGMVTHPGNGNWSGTLMNALLGHNRQLAEMGEDFRAGIVHRLDKDTSGLMVAAKDEIAHRKLSLQFKEKTLEKKYIALVWGQPKKKEGVIEGNLARSHRDRKIFTVREDGKYALTRYKIVEYFELFSSLEIQLDTGRTHQIRVHLSHSGHPVLGDPVYHGRSFHYNTLDSFQRELCNRCLKIMTRQALHAKTLGFTHPATGEFMRFDSELPEDFEDTLKILRENKQMV